MTTLRKSFAITSLFLLLGCSESIVQSDEYSYDLAKLPEVPKIPIQKSKGLGFPFDQYKADSSGKKKNFIFIMADDMGIGDLNCYGNPIMKTPNIDKLADEGLMLTNFHSSSAVCSPSRAAILSGRFPIRFNYSRHFWDTTFDFMSDTIYTLADHFQKNGYFTAHVGKWHLGGMRPQDIKNRLNGDSTTPGPYEQGFDYYFGGFEDQKVHWSLAKKNAYYRESWRYSLRNDSLAPLEPGHLSELKTNETIELIKKCSENNLPYFINLWYDIPHTPYEPIDDPELKSYYQDQDVPEYSLNTKMMITKMDQQIGRIISYLEESGLIEDCIIVFTSDNGAAYGGSSLNLKGGKATLYEGGINVPCIFYGLEKDQTISERIHPLNFIDFFPSISEIFGLGEVQNTKLDGMNVFIDQNDFKHRKLYYKILENYYLGPHDSDPGDSTTEAITVDGFKLLMNRNSIVGLYYLEDDPTEQNNLKNKMPWVVNVLQYDYLKFEWGSWEERERMKRNYLNRKAKMNNPTTP